MLSQRSLYARTRFVHKAITALIGCSIKVAKAINDAGTATNSVIISPSMPKNVIIISL